MYSDFLAWNGHRIDWFTLALIAVGGPLRLSARVHGSCEIHGWVDGPNRAWLADVVEEGLASGVLRYAYQTQYENWPGVVALLRRTSRPPVVMAYSVTESFPNPYLVKPQTRPYNEMTGTSDVSTTLKPKPGRSSTRAPSGSRRSLRCGLRTATWRLGRRDWRAFRFTHRLSALDLLAKDWKSRLGRAFPAYARSDMRYETLRQTCCLRIHAAASELRSPR